jgi:lipopolysaccharide heptosyltransferase II
MINAPEQQTERTGAETQPAMLHTVSSRIARARDIMADARHVAVVTKLRYMGDTIVATPCLRQLRQCVPNAEITLITSPSVATALENCPYVDRMIALHARDKSRVRQTFDLLSALRERAFTGALLLNRSFHCALTSVLAGIPIRVGYTTELRGPLITVPVPYPFDRHEVACHLNMLDALGWQTKPELPELWISPDETAKARNILLDSGWQPDIPLIAVQPGSNDAPVRAWGAERYAKVADRLANELGGQVLIIGGSSERAEAQRTQQSMTLPAINVTGRLELRQALSMIGLADLWVGNDTGLLHAAVAQGVPSVGIFGPNKLVRWGYDASLHRSLAMIPDSPARTDSDVRRCLDAISEQSVLETAHEVYSLAAQRRVRNSRLENDTRAPYRLGGDGAPVISMRRR